MVVQFRQIKRSLVAQFRQIKCSWRNSSAKIKRSWVEHWGGGLLADTWWFGSAKLNVAWQNSSAKIKHSLTEHWRGGGCQQTHGGLVYFRHIKRSLAEQFCQIKRSFAEHWQGGGCQQTRGGLVQRSSLHLILDIILFLTHISYIIPNCNFHHEIQVE